MQIKQMNGESLQVFAPDAAKSQVNTAVTGTKVFKKGTGADFNITNWCCMRVVPTLASTYYFNTDSTKTMAMPANSVNDIWVIDPGITQVTLVLAAGTASVQGM
jgi:hypothetical protein